MEESLHLVINHMEMLFNATSPRRAGIPMARRREDFIRAEGDFPICIVFLVDGSNSMLEPYKGREDVTKAEVASGIVNDLILEMNENCKTAFGLSPRYLLGIIIYGDDAVNACTQKGLAEMVQVTTIGPDDGQMKVRWSMGGGALEKDHAATWFDVQELHHGGWTRMDLGFDAVRALLTKNVLGKEEFNFPLNSSFPIIIHITDGAPAYKKEMYFEETVDAIKRLRDECRFGKNLPPKTKKWAPLICNVYMDKEEGGEEIIFPSAAALPQRLTGDKAKLANWLYEISDLLPIQMQAMMQKKVEMEINEQAVAFIWDANAAQLFDLILWMTRISTVVHDGPA